MASRYGSEVIEEALYIRLNNDFTHTRVPGLTEIPLILIERPVPGDIEPYIYINVEDSEEIDVTKDRSSRIYYVTIQVVTRSQHNQSAERQRDLITDEVVRIIDVGTDNYIELVNEGYSVYEQNVKAINIAHTEERGATYWFGNITCEITAEFIDLPQDRDPVQAAQFTFSGFEFLPMENQIECFDSGRITGDTSYPSNNNGWDFRSATYSLINGGQGTLTGNNLDVGTTDDPLGLITEINYEFGTDNTISTSITDTDTFQRIKSLRFGSRSSNSVSSADLQDLTAWNIDYGNTNPVGTTLTLQGTAGEYLYFVYDEDVTITGLIGTLGANELPNFDLTTLDGFNILILNRALVLDYPATQITIQ